MPSLEPNKNLFSSSIPQTWREYWNLDQSWRGSKIWQINARILAGRLTRLVQLSQDDRVLTVGCGSGYLENLLAPRVRSILATDTSEHFVKECSELCHPHMNVQTALLGENYTQISRFGKFSLVICSSVVQYYKNFQELEDLLRSAREAVIPGGRILISDLPLEKRWFGKLGDLSCTLIEAGLRGYLPDLLGHFLSLSLKPSGYRIFSKINQSLFFPMPVLQNLIKKSDMRGEIIPGKLSVHVNRPGLLFRA